MPLTDNNELKPHEHWLDKKKDKLNTFLIEKFNFCGISPDDARTKVDDFLSQLHYLDIPDLKYSGIQTLKDLVAIEKIVQNLKVSQLTKSAAELIEYQRIALQDVKESFLNHQWTSLSQVENNFKDFITVSKAIEKLYFTFDMVLLSGTCQNSVSHPGRRLYILRSRIMRDIKCYFEANDKNHNFLLERFNQNVLECLEAENSLKESELFGIEITNIMLISNSESVGYPLGYVNEIVSDCFLLNWLEQRNIQLDEPDGYVSAHEKNMILLNALNVFPNQWSQLFVRSLVWLTQRELKNEVLNNIHYKNILHNILLCACICKSEYLDLHEKQYFLDTNFRTMLEAPSAYSSALTKLLIGGLNLKK